MKKKVISLLLAVGMVLGLTACGGGNAGLAVTIEGKQYDFSQDIGALAEQMEPENLALASINPMEMSKIWICQEDGSFLSTDRSEVEDFTLIQVFRTGYAPLSPVRMNIFSLRNDLSFEMAGGITPDSDDDDLENLEGYSFYRGNYNRGENMYYALYVDGQIINLDDYKDEYEAWEDDVEEVGDMAAYLKHLADIKYYMSHPILNVDYAKTAVSQVVKEEKFAEDLVLLAFAVMDAGRKLEDEKIDSYDIVKFYYDEEYGVNAEIEHYFYDDTDYIPDMREGFEEHRAEQLEQMLNQ